MPSSNELVTKLRAHAPDGYPETSLNDLASAISDGVALNMIVLAADIRKSTSLMKEARHLVRFAQLIGLYVTTVGELIRRENAWFDKFTGDGFLAYWITEGNPEHVVYDELLRVANAIVHTFGETVEPELRENSQNYPSRTGISIGIDAGTIHPVEIAGDVTIVGPAVVGAVRMVSTAEPNEVVINVSLGERIAKARDQITKRFALSAADRVTKEYSEGQRVYTILFQ
jgi:class 3 adenylate cyclase